MKISALATPASREHECRSTPDGRLASKAERLIKRWMDIAISLPALVLLAPLLGALAFLIKLQDGGPVLFAQKRVGFYGREFSCYKLRSMTVNAEQMLAGYLANNDEAAREWLLSQKLVRDPRVTPAGRFIRKTSLDELPQLYNVLLGEMSLVGPRPVLRAELDRYGDDLKFYLSMKPGITGLWQVSGRSECSYQERIAMDRAYAQNWRLTDDIMILLKTIPAVLRQRGSC